MKRIICLILTLVITMSLCACTAGKDNPTEPVKPTNPVSTTPEDPDVTNPTDPFVPEDPTEAEDPTEPSVSLEDLPKPEVNYDGSKTALTAYIVDRAYGATGQNTMFSPLSLDMALGMVAEGAGSEYQALFPVLLGKDDYSQFAAEYMEHVKDLNKESDSEYSKYKTVFDIANSVWISDKYEALESYKEKVSDFSPELMKLDFSDLPSVVVTINTWCKEKTRDMIEEVVSENDFTKDSIAVIVNAIYFESPWLESWNVVGENEEFTKFDSNKSEVKMISTTTDSYYENEYATAFGCQYKNGLTFIGILPKEEGDFLVQDLDLESLLASQTYQYDVDAKMPTFKFENRIDDLVGILSDTGYGILFDKDVGMFNQMLTDGEDNVPMAISKIIQMDAIELDENGTKAAAVTAIIMDACTSIPQEVEVKTVTLDRPFAFVIYDSYMDQIVFVGKVVNP